MLRKSQALFALCLVLALSACQQQSAPTAAPAASAPPARAATPAASATASADSVGVPECDDYLNKYQACVDSKVPEAARAAFRQSLDQTRGAWRTALTTPGAKEGLASACKQARDATRASMSAYGCTDF